VRAFLRVARGGAAPATLLRRFPPAVAKTTRNGIEYAFGAIPLGGFVTIPGMHRPIPHDAERRFAHAVDDAPTLGGSVDRVKRALEGSGSDLTAAQHAVDEFDQELATHTVSPAARATADKGITELRDALGPDAYWKAPTWKRLVAIGAGPAANILLTIVLFTFLFMTVAGEATRTIDTVASELRAGQTSPAQVVGLRAGDTIVAIDGKAVKADEIAETIGDSGGQQLTLTVVRDGKDVTIGPVSAELVDGRYGLGFSLQGEGSGRSSGRAPQVEVTGIVQGDRSSRLGESRNRGGRDDVLEPHGNHRALPDAVERGAGQLPSRVLGLVSFARAPETSCRSSRSTAATSSSR
jgi:membrane-associated protease RseP (regulator of RpoE activity)